MKVGETNGRSNGRAHRTENAIKRESRQVAVFRMERVLCEVTAELGAAWIASYTTSVRTRLLRVGGAMWGVPSRALGADPTMRTRTTWMGVEGMSRDRIEVLGEQFARDRIICNLRDRATTLIRDAKQRGEITVLISSSIEEVARHVASHMGFDHAFFNRLEYRSERATGRLLDPICHGTSAALLLKRWASEHQVDLSQSRAFAGLHEDTPLLSSVGSPCATHPDRRLRASADSLDWPIIVF